ncbi:beta-lactamase/transpeptidase-like protein [Aaosphaeria arxii CBS 175.79]|uniref:Beta-lactamase/transpeptidase-like protein n=1 Tax=Aaosphaeria arxii CBS 175.79 TaxID=1450172 RepID=A0A6A5XQZ4_9PLEO|nr:beta-lactamase/transpeptidase-like protein [Aaosphaeria arxii CBS 175.79]KAF2015353.1 beta-lactamase/transpeptidase-like protein [Aaosphaeria arxii CBS 175.79]
MLFTILPLFGAALVKASCPGPSEVHPLPDYDPKDPILQEAFKTIHTTLNTIIADPQYDPLSFSVEITSSKETLWSQHHTARERNSSRPDIPEVNGDALYRIASITKSFTVLGLLYQHAAGNLSLDDAITKYIPELKGKQEGTIPWDDITLRSLASQLSGLPRDFAQTDYINDWWGSDDPTKLGFPPLSREGLLECDEFGDNYEPSCKRADLLKAVKAKDPVFAPNQKSSYSNLAFEIVGLAVANVTNQTYESYIKDAIFDPLEMTKSTLSLPPDSAGVIPVGSHYWDVDAGVQNPTGGIYSSSKDLSKYLRYILTKYNGITHALNWAHPVSPGDGLQTFYGTPWEIFRTDEILLGSKRSVRFITKSGGLPGYQSIIMTVPEYDLGITILVAGTGRIFTELLEAVTVEAVRAAEEVAIRQLHERYAGEYAAEQAGLNTSMILVADERGLVLERFISNGTDVLESQLKQLLGPHGGDIPWYAILAPTLLYSNEKKEEGEKWRILGVQYPNPQGHKIWDNFCPTDYDRASYAGKPFNEVIFWGGEGNTVETIEATGFRAKLVRENKEKGFLEENMEL